MKYADLKIIEASGDAHALMDALNHFDADETRDSCTLRVNNRIELDCYLLSNENEYVIVLTEKEAPDFLCVDEAFPNDAELLRVAIFQDKLAAQRELRQAIMKTSVFDV